MRIAYLDCASGISGDMTLGALVDVGIPLDSIQCGIESLGLSGCRLEAEEVKRRGFRATKLHVRHEPEHAHRHLHHIVDMIAQSQLTDSQKDLAKRIFTRLGEAEARVHGTTIEKVHFHEVGAVDSIADIVGSAIAWDLLGVDQIVCSPIPTGHGTIEIAHGRVSVPAPATAELLKGIPLANSVVDAELTTPTGAAIVATIVDRFDTAPVLTVERIGYGAGDKDFEKQSNILRLLVGESIQEDAAETIVVLETNVDDVTGEVIGHCCEQLFQAGALDVYTTSIQMKKSRPGTKISVLCSHDDRSEMEGILFRETGTLGIRRWHADRQKLKRVEHSVQTPWGPIKGKLVTLPNGSSWFSPEYESCREIALSESVAVRDVEAVARQAYSH